MCKRGACGSTLCPNTDFENSYVARFLSHLKMITYSRTLQFCSHRMCTDCSYDKNDCLHGFHCWQTLSSNGLYLTQRMETRSTVWLGYFSDVLQISWKRLEIFENITTG